MLKEERYAYELLKDKKSLTEENYNEIPFDSCILLYMLLTGEREVLEQQFEKTALQTLSEEEIKSKIKELGDYIWGEED